MSFGGLLGSLYGDLPAPKSGPPPVSNESNGLNLPRPTASKEAIVELDQNASSLLNSNVVLSKGADTLLMPAAARRKIRPPPVVAPIPQAKRIKESVVYLNSSPSVNPPSFATERVIVSDGTSSRLLPPQKIFDEYDPCHPNSYDEYCKERIREQRKREETKRQQEEMERLHEEQKRIMATASPASLEISGDKAWLRRKQLSETLFGNQPTSATALAASTVTSTITTTAVTNTTVATKDAKPFLHLRQSNELMNSSKQKKSGFAQKMLEKMGWKEGEGLGREKQGMLAPLVARKTDKRSGVIIQGAGKPAVPSNAPVPTPTPTADLFKDATRILLLTNMVTRGEVDDDLEAETAEEGAKYGNLLAVKIKEIPSLPDDECVRIFCEYDTSDAAIKAFSNFNNRLFGGRNVKAQFFNEEYYMQDMLC